MSLVPYRLVKPFLFQMDAERAHHLTLSGLALTQNTPLQCVYGQKRIQDPVQLAGLTFPNRVGLAAGLDKNARCIDGLAGLGFGFIEVGTVTPQGQSGNPQPRIFRLPQAEGIINRLGFNNDGLDAFVANVRNARIRRTTADQASPIILGLNIGKNAATPIERATDDYLRCLEGVYPYADYVAVNISSPNTANLRTLQNDAALDALLHALAKRRDTLASQHQQRKPIFVKIAPDLDETQVEAIAQALVRNGMDGVIATNTTLQRDAVSGLPHSQESGGLSGKPVLASSNRVIQQLRASLGASFPIIGVGGVMRPEDAISKIQAGADVVQIYTGLIYRGPDLVRDSALALQKLRRQ